MSRGTPTPAGTMVPAGGPDRGADGRNWIVLPGSGSRAVERGGQPSRPLRRRSRRPIAALSYRAVKIAPAEIGAGNNLPHLTVGAAKFDDLKTIEAEPFDAFDVCPPGSPSITWATMAPPGNCSRRGR